MKSLISVLASFIIIFAINGQQKGSNISFEKEAYDFGKIMEMKGSVSYTYYFTNTGSEPLIIQKVQASCGCTTPEWSEAPVVPGGKGFIKATFNPAGRPGTFSKSINITTNSVAGKTIILKLSGEVIGKASSAGEQFPFLIDNLRFSSVYIAYGKISPKNIMNRNLEVLNVGNAPLTISFPSTPQHIGILVNPSTIKPNQKATITFSYNASKKNDWGFVTDAIQYTINGKNDGKYKINISASIEDDYSKATAQQLASAPKLTLEKTVFNIGKIKAGANIALSYRFKNLGKTNLEIHKVVSSCECTNVKTKETTIKPGAIGEITGVFNSAGLKGVINKTITLITNDPDNLNQVLWIRGTVE